MEENYSIETLTLLEQERARAEREIAQTVTGLRKHHGTSWTAIGAALGLSKQTAYARYGKLEALEERQDKALEAWREAMKATPNLSKKSDDPAPAKAKKPSKKSDAAAPAKVQHSIISGIKVGAPHTGIRTQHAIPIPDTTAQPGIGKGMGPHTCPSCGSNNHKTENPKFAEFNADCTPTQYDPPKIAYLMWETNR